MCERDDPSLKERGAFDWSPNRRQFAALGSMAALAACTTGTTGMSGNASLAEDMVSITTADGTMDAFYVRPSSGKHPAILTWPDIARPARCVQGHGTAAGGAGLCRARRQPLLPLQQGAAVHRFRRFHGQ